MKKLSIILFFILSYTTLLAQISEGGIPPSFNITETKLSQKPLIQKAELDIDIAVLRKEDALNVNKNIPQRVAVLIPFEKDLAKKGEWITLETGERICRMTVKAEGASGIVLYYSKFNIPYGGKLFIYDQEKIQLLGAYTHRTNPHAGAFVTEMIYGDELTLEYVAPANNTGSPEIIISDIAYGYNNLDSYNYFSKALPDSTGFLLSGSCQVNINCEEGRSWQIQKKGVARTYTRMNRGMYRCSGSLINNVNNDKKAYYLSAYHCFYKYRYVADFETILFYFNYEFPDCANGEHTPAETRTLVGAQLLVASPIDGGSDGVLLELNDAIPEDYDVYFNGWDISNKASTNGVCIHHPQGDLKKISTYNSTLRTGTYEDSEDTSAPNAHWMLRFSSTRNGHGTTEGGSSGSPLFGQNGLIVGSLTGGRTSCTNRNDDDYFAKMWYHYDQHVNTSYHMKPYLNSTNQPVTTLRGIANKNTSPGEIENTKTIYAYWDESAGEGHHSRLVVRTKDDTNSLKRIRIVNFRGFEVLDKNTFAFDTYDEIDSTGWPRGLYIVIVQAADGRRSFKLMK